MGLRFRKSISILPGVKLNLSKSGVSVSAGVKGFRNTINTKGKLTTSVGIPGSGVSYVKQTDLKKIVKGKTSKKDEEKETSKKTKSSKKSKAAKEEATPVVADSKEAAIEEAVAQTPAVPVAPVDINAVKSIHKMADETIEWEEFEKSPTPPDSSYDLETWQYYHKLSKNILAGNVDTYLRLIYEVNPLDDLLMYGSNFEFGTDDPTIMEVEFVVNEEALASAKASMKDEEYNELLADYVSSVCIRIGRDMFALIPVDHVIVHTVLGDKTIISVDFDRENFSKLKFGFIDTSDALSKFRNSMDFDKKKGFSGVNRLI